MQKRQSVAGSPCPESPGLSEEHPLIASVCVCVCGRHLLLYTHSQAPLGFAGPRGWGQGHQDAPGAGQGLFVACEEVSENTLGGTGGFHIQTCPHTPGHVAPPEGVGCCVG